jgi:phosphotransferase system enzyme I (PtsI)
MERFFKGIPASGGVALGVAVVFLKTNLFIPKYKIEHEENLEQEIDKLENALLRTRNELEELKKDMSKTALETGYLDSSILMLDDPMLRKQVQDKIHESWLNIEWIFNEVIEEMSVKLEKSEDAYFRERAPDVISIGQKVLKNLMGREELDIPKFDGSTIVVAHTLSPHEIITLFQKGVGGFVTEIGGRTSHVAIMARDLQIPSVVGVTDVTRKVNTNEQIIVDGMFGTVIAEPRHDTRTLYTFKEREQRRYAEYLKKIEKEDPALRTGEPIRLLANMDLEEEIDLVTRCGCTGIGLFRTEYMFMNRDQAPAEEEQAAIYGRISEAINPHHVVIRVIDVGGDKRPSYLMQYDEANPFLGLRGIRYLINHKDLLRTQMRAILRASVRGNVKLMFPMVNDPDELHQVLSVLDSCRETLEKHNIEYDENLQVGVMVETPSSVILLDRILDSVDFVSVGTNDLIQYTLAIDRGNGMVAGEFDPMHPAILRSLARISETASSRGIDLSICGEMAGDPLYTLLLVGLGYRSLSMGVMTIPMVKNILLQSDLDDARRIASRALKYGHKSEVDAYVRGQMRSRFPDLEDYFR